MRVNGEWLRTIGRHGEGVRVIDQRLLPHRLSTVDIRTRFDACEAIRNMTVRGAGLIGATAAWGMALAAKSAAMQSCADFQMTMEEASEALRATRPTAVNLATAVHRVMAAMDVCGTVPAKVSAAVMTAQGISDEDAAFCRRIGWNTLPLIRRIHAAKSAAGIDPTVHVLTHCNAGWFAFVDFGSALAPVYAAAREGIPVHVWVDETRPRGQGASLTAYELLAAGIPHDLVADNVGGHLMQRGLVDLCLVGADRVTRNGDAANKIGTYLKALAAKDNDVPFLVAFPSSTIDWKLSDGVDTIPIEERDGDEERYAVGRLDTGAVGRVLVCPEGTSARNYAFDVTPSRLITGFVTERGECEASEAGLLSLYPDAGCLDVMRTEEGTLSMAAEGVVRFSADCVRMPLPEALQGMAAELNAIRAPLYRLHMIGSADGVGYGNISARISVEYGAFLISGTATGGLDMLSDGNFAVVEGSLPSENKVLAYGEASPSSEAMTHAAVYVADPSVGSVIHAHCRPLFERLKERLVPATPSDVTYGTPGMAFAVAELVRANPGSGVFISLGHQDGIFAYGPDAKAASEMLMTAFTLG